MRVFQWLVCSLALGVSGCTVEGATRLRGTIVKQDLDLHASPGESECEHRNTLNPKP